jgi:hypothetical protein
MKLFNYDATENLSVKSVAICPYQHCEKILRVRSKA